MISVRGIQSKYSKKYAKGANVVVVDFTPH